MGLVESKNIDVNNSIKINIEFYTYFHDNKYQELKGNIGNIIIEKSKIFKPFIATIIKEAMNMLKYRCYINYDNIFMELYYKGDEFLSIGIIINVEGVNLITEEMIKLAIIHKVNDSNSLELDKNIFVKLQENDLLRIIVSQ